MSATSLPNIIFVLGGPGAGKVNLKNKKFLNKKPIILFFMI